eukprot:CCRYP_009769-RA/>CCRYP_009769-RA protein AED:0.08 eAED:0.08 QI:868/1/1/1/0.66/0.5/4/445/483
MSEPPTDSDNENAIPAASAISPRKKVKVSLVDHTYHDWSQLEIQQDDDDDASDSETQPSPAAIAGLQPVHAASGGGGSSLSICSTQRKGIENFPAKLHKILSSGRYRNIITWMPHGRSWTILDKERLSSVVCPENFSHSNFDSFNRSVNGWGFKRLMREGPDHKSYYHECFLRGRPDLTKFMTRLVNPGKRLPDPKGEPNFYKMAKDFPLPPDPEPEPEVPNSQQQASQHPFMGGFPQGMPQGMTNQPQTQQGMPGQPPPSYYPGFPYGAYPSHPQGGAMVPQQPFPGMPQAGAPGPGVAPGFPPYPYPYPQPGLPPGMPQGMPPGMAPQPGMHPGMFPQWPQYPGMPPQAAASYPQNPYAYPPHAYGYGAQMMMNPMQQPQQPPMQGQPPPQGQWGQAMGLPPGMAYPNPYGQQFPPHAMPAGAVPSQAGGEEYERKPSARKRHRDDDDEEDDDQRPVKQEEDNDDNAGDDEDDEEDDDDEE